MSTRIVEHTLTATAVPAPLALVLAPAKVPASAGTVPRTRRSGSRPPAMIYELLRVARKGVVLIEPQDHKDRGDKYEEAGNYVYSLSHREMSKLARAANLAAVATKGQNDAFEAGLELLRE